MDRYDYLIIGTGMTADAAVRGIRELDAKGRIGLIGEDPNPPYSRPPLSKSLWKGKPLDAIWRKTAELSVELITGRSVTSINKETKTVQDDKGNTFGYGKLLIATGGRPRKLPFGGEDIIYFRTLDDYRQLRELCGKQKHFGIIGGGFIGSEVAAALAMNGEKVTMLFPEEGIGARVYPREVTLFLNDYFRQHGVEVLAELSVKDLIKNGDSFQVMTKEDKTIQVDAVIAGIGIIPNVELAQAAGLQIGNGIVVDEQLRTAQADIYAAGDVAEYFQPLLGKRVRLEHEDNALEMGKQAGRNMTGAGEIYGHLSYFYSDLFDLGYEAVGELDPRLEIFIDWQEPFKKGVIYYLSNGKVGGVLLWDVWGARPAAQALIQAPGPFTTGDLKGKLG
jgi:NADPH-dependent 2,4-dienoyl-CoA reductase/sulfur reductase-like enzyme